MGVLYGYSFSLRIFSTVMRILRTVKILYFAGTFKRPGVRHKPYSQSEQYYHVGDVHSSPLVVPFADGMAKSPCYVWF